MIPQNQLRDGNYCSVFLEDEKETVIIKLSIDRGVTGFVQTGKHKGEEVLCIDLSKGDLNPIPLTPEILKKAEFNIIDFDGYDKGLYHKDINNGLYGDAETGYTLVDSEGGDISFEKAIKYLHQLQNLYFALTGEELKINL